MSPTLTPSSFIAHNTAFSEIEVPFATMGQSWNPRDGTPNLSGKVALVTGAK